MNHYQSSWYGAPGGAVQRPTRLAAAITASSRGGDNGRDRGVRASTEYCRG